MKFISIFLSSTFLGGYLLAQEVSTTTEWKLLGATETINTQTAFNRSCIQVVWGYDSATGWQQFTPSGTQSLTAVAQGRGFWIKGNQACTFNTSDGSSSASLTSTISNKTISLQGSNTTFEFCSDGGYTESGTDDTSGAPYTIKGAWAVDESKLLVTATSTSVPNAGGTFQFTSSTVQSGTTAYVKIDDGSKEGNVIISGISTATCSSTTLPEAPTGYQTHSEVSDSSSYVTSIGDYYSKLQLGGTYSENFSSSLMLALEGSNIIRVTREGFDQAAGIFPPTVKAESTIYGTAALSGDVMVWDFINELSTGNAFIKQIRFSYTNNTLQQTLYYR